METGWLIEAAHVSGLPLWVAVNGGCPYWTTKSELAIRFARREDALRAATAFAPVLALKADCLTATEHQWG